MNTPWGAMCLAGLLTLSARAADSPAPYEPIAITPLFAQLIIRDQADRVYSGQVKSQAGLAVFEQAYGLSLPRENLDFTRHVLVFGLTDNLSTRVFRFVTQPKLGTFTLDYADTGIKFKLRVLEPGRKYSYLQIFRLDRREDIGHISVKNFVLDGLSKVYDQ